MLGGELGFLHGKVVDTRAARVGWRGWMWEAGPR